MSKEEVSTSDQGEVKHSCRIYCLESTCSEVVPEQELGESKMREPDRRLVFLWAVCLTIALGAPIATGQSQATYQFDMPEQSLADALRAIAQLTGASILFDSSSVEDVLVPAFRGQLTTDEAIQRVLAGTKLEVQRTAPNAIIVQPQSAARANGSNTADARGNKSALAQVRHANPDRNDKSNRAGSSLSAQPLPVGQSDSSQVNSEKIDSDAVPLNEIVVTGTNIRGTRNTNVIDVNRERIERSGSIDVGEVIRSIPQNFGAGNNPGAIGAPGENFSISAGSAPNLRGLGATSTLTLLNGRRLPQDTASGAVDISGIPLAAIERIDVLPDGASAVYGSDAVAGVVNLILRDKYEGATTTVLYGDSTDGGGATTQFNQLFGTSWNSGSLVLSYDFNDREAVYSDDRSYTQLIARPYTLFPDIEQHALFASVKQQLSEGVDITFDTLLNVRDVFSEAASPPFVTTSFGDVEFGHVNAELGFSLPKSWELRVGGTASRQESIFDASFALESDPDVPLFEGRVEAFKGETVVAELIADGPFAELFGRTARMAVGAGFRREEFSDDTGTVFSTFSDRDVGYAFGEFQIPIVQLVDLNISGRVEEFSDAGTSFVPRLGITYKPSEIIKFRASWGESFHAPNLARRDATPNATLQLVASATSPGDAVPVLFLEGGNADLDPETAVTYTAGIDLTPTDELSVSLTAFQIDYDNRIARIPNILTVLTDPANDPFIVTLSPSAQEQQEVIDSVDGLFFDFTGLPYDPALVAAIADNRYRNIASQTATGVDLIGDFRLPVGRGILGIRGNVTYLDLEQRVTPQALEQQLSGMSFSPAELRSQVGFSYDLKPWSMDVAVNYVDEAINAAAGGNDRVSSWTTVDLQFAWRPVEGSLKGFTAALSAQNLLNEEPPTVNFGAFVPGLTYDSLNHSALGRFISLRLSKEF